MDGFLPLCLSSSGLFSLFLFTKDYFAFWVLISIAWGFGAAIVITFLPLMELSAELTATIKGIFGMAEASPEKEYAAKEGDNFDEA